jgi:UDP-glucuronate decarboxylase
MMRVLVTGAAGFLGSHLSMHHLVQGDLVFGIDNFCSSTRSSAHYRALCEHPNFTMVEGDISASTGWQRSLKKIRCLDVAYNFACPASPPIYQRIPIETLMTCVVGTKNILDFAGDRGARIVHASTSEVYGDPELIPQAEAYRGSVNSYGPRSCYDEGKRAAESLCYDYLHKHGTDARLVRIFNTYGPNMDPDDGRVISNFICQGIRGQDLTVYGDGSQTRSFCYVDDLIRGIVALGELPKNPGGPVNMGNPNEFTILELAQNVAKRFGVGITFRSLPCDDPLQRRPDTSLARAYMGWDARVQLEEGLDLSIEYFRKVCK